MGSSAIRVENPGPKDPALGYPKEAAQGTGHKAKIIKTTYSLSLCLAPYTLHPKPLLLAKPLNSDLALSTRFSIFNE
jgi:hypothetical protein